jgi:hypothetical protein
MFDENQVLDFPHVSQEFKDYVNLDNFCKYFKCFDEEKFSYVLVECKLIQTKAIKIQGLKQKFFSKIMYSFEHD